MGHGYNCLAVLRAVRDRFGIRCTSVPLNGVEGSRLNTGVHSEGSGVELSQASGGVRSGKPSRLCVCVCVRVLHCTALHCTALYRRDAGVDIFHGHLACRPLQVWGGGRSLLSLLPRSPHYDQDPRAGPTKRIPRRLKLLKEVILHKI